MTSKKIKQKRSKKFIFDKMRKATRSKRKGIKRNTC